MSDECKCFAPVPGLRVINCITEGLSAPCWPCRLLAVEAERDALRARLAEMVAAVRGEADRLEHDFDVPIYHARSIRAIADRFDPSKEKE